VVAGRRASTLHTFGIVTNNITCKLRHQHSSDSSLISTELKGVPRSDGSLKDREFILREKYKKELEETPSFHVQAFTWEITPALFLRTRPKSEVLQTGHHVETKRISTSGPRHPHKEESLVRATKHVPNHYLVLGERTRTGLDSDRKTHEQSRSSHRQFVRCTRGEFFLIRKRGRFGG